MKFELQWANCLWLMLPLLIWNILLGPRIKDERITSDNHSPKWLLIGENFTRILVFALPLLMPLQIEDFFKQPGSWVYIIGTLIYLSTWLPFLFTPRSAWCNMAGGLLAPRITPVLPFLGAAWLGHSWLYALAAALFVALHTWHGVQNIRGLEVTHNITAN
jgi:hypothetical protein